MEISINHKYIFLTKKPENIKIIETPDNGWFGVTVTSSKEELDKQVKEYADKNQFMYVIRETNYIYTRGGIICPKKKIKEVQKTL